MLSKNMNIDTSTSDYLISSNGPLLNDNYPIFNNNAQVKLVQRNFDFT